MPVAMLDSHKFTVPYNWMLEVDSFLDDMTRKVAAESERLLRLLPHPPEGYRWVLTTYREENLEHKNITLFVRAELKGLKHEHREETREGYPQKW